MTRVVDLTAGALADLPDNCRRCVFWEVADADRGPRAARFWREDSEAKEAWWQAAQLEWGPPGKAAYADDRLVGYATFGPVESFPRARRIGKAVSDDALLLATMWVDPSHHGQGLGKLLLRHVLRDTHRRGGRALEAFGAKGTDPDLCVLAEAFLLANGFTVLHDDTRFPLLRLDLRQTVRWQESVGQAVERALAALERRRRVPAARRPALELRGRR